MRRSPSGGPLCHGKWSRDAAREIFLECVENRLSLLPRLGFYLRPVQGSAASHLGFCHSHSVPGRKQSSWEPAGTAHVSAEHGVPVGAGSLCTPLPSGTEGCAPGAPLSSSSNFLIGWPQSYHSCLRFKNKYCADTER